MLLLRFGNIQQHSDGTLSVVFSLNNKHECFCELLTTTGDNYFGYIYIFKLSQMLTDLIFTSLHNVSTTVHVVHLPYVVYLFYIFKLPFAHIAVVGNVLCLLPYNCCVLISQTVLLLQIQHTHTFFPSKGVTFSHSLYWNKLLYSHLVSHGLPRFRVLGSSCSIEWNSSK